jgi:hypothetical protein
VLSIVLGINIPTYRLAGHMSKSGVTHKLGEAHYFLRELQEKSKKAYKGERDHEIITYLFSAYANATYGVHCALQKTVKRHQYNSVLRKWKKESLSKDERALFELMYAQRGKETHEAESECSEALKSHVESRPAHPTYTIMGANTSFTVPAFETKEIELGSGRKLIQKKPWYYKRGFATVVLDHTHDEIEGEQIQTVENCVHYLNLLEHLCSVFPQRKP